MDISSLPDNLQRLVNDELASGERIRWVSQPVPRAGFPRLRLFLFLVALPLMLFAILWMAGASGVLDPVNGIQGFGQLDPTRVVFALFGLPLVLVGIGMLCSPFWVRRCLVQAAKQTGYVVTDSRAIVFGGGYAGDNDLAALLTVLLRFLGQGTTVRSWTPEQLGRIERVERDDSSGDVIFGEVPLVAEGDRRSSPTKAGFFSIQDAKEVAALLKSLAGGRTGNVNVSESSPSSSPSATVQTGSRSNFLFFAVFFCAGVGCLILMLATVIIPEWRANHSYVENSCVVLDKRLGRSNGNHGTVYRPEIHIRHTVNGQVFQLWTYEASGGYSGSQSRTEDILAGFVVGQAYPCWFNPEDPSQAVLVRNYSWLPHMMLLVPLLLIAVGGGGMYVNWHRRDSEPLPENASSAAVLDVG